MTASPNPLTVTITGAAGQIGYSLLPLLASGSVFGRHQPLNLHLLEIEPAKKALSGVVLELEDLASPILKSIVPTTEAVEAFTNCDVAILVGAFPRRPGMTRRDLLSKNIPIFSSHARILEKVAAPDVAILVVGNPANTNALVLSRAAPKLNPRRITALTRLDHNRAVAAVARELSVSVSDVSGVAVWGNHSSTQYPDVTRARVDGKPVLDRLGGHDGVAGQLVPSVQKRGGAVLDRRGATSAMSAAAAIADHLRSWLVGDDADGKHVSMAVPSDGSYGVKEGVWFSFPVRCPGGGEYEIVQSVEFDEFMQRYIDATKEELFAEREEALTLLD
uniref:Malate dehydrogenase n=1 Tax=Campylaephora kondoi TaxID=218449 RepID=A0A097IUR2_9FLOR|nr:malate dehydrogenase [Campylaephora kondoi]